MTGPDIFILCFCFFGLGMVVGLAIEILKHGSDT